MKKFFIKNSNGEFSEGDIFDTNANDHTNIRFGSFLGVFISMFLLVSDLGWVATNIFGGILLVVTIVVGILTKGAGVFFKEIIGTTFFLGSFVLTFFVSSWVAKHSNLLVGIVVGYIVFKATIKLVEKIFFE